MLKTTKVIYKSFRSSFSNCSISGSFKYLALKPLALQPQSGQRSFAYNNYKKSNTNEGYNNFSEINSAPREGKYARGNDQYSNDGSSGGPSGYSEYQQDNRRSPDRGYQRQDRTYGKAYSIMKDNAMLSTNFVKPRTVNEGGKTQVKPGYIVLDFLPVSREAEGKPKIDAQAKKTFVLTQKNLGDFLMLDPKAKYSTEHPQELLISLNQSEKASERVLRIVHSADKKFEITYMEITNEEVSLDISLVINQGEFLVIYKLIESSIPNIFGWTSDNKD